MFRVLARKIYICLIKCQSWAQVSFIKTSGAKINNVTFLKRISFLQIILFCLENDEKRDMAPSYHAPISNHLYSAILLLFIM